MLKRCFEEKPLPPLPKSPSFRESLPSSRREVEEKDISFSPIPQNDDNHGLSSVKGVAVLESHELFGGCDVKEMRATEDISVESISLEEEPVLPSYSRRDYWSFTQGLKHSVDSHNDPKPSQLGWKPITLRLPVLLTITFISLGFIAILQWLAYKSRANGGIQFAPSLKSVATRDTFTFLYAPVVLAVLYSIVWTWIDLDTKRIEPYLRLCDRDGATATESIYLNYATDFIALVPFKAARLRHWAVFSAGVALLTVFWAITPLTSAIFNLNEIPVPSTVEIVDTSRVIPIEDQINKINGNMFNDAYNYQWHNRSLPPFTTADRVIIPFGISTTTSLTLGQNGTITSNATSFFTKLNCAFPQPIHNCSVEYANSEDPLAGISNGKGCSVSYVSGEPGLRTRESIYSVGYTGWYDSAQSVGLRLQGCPCDNSPSTFLATLGSPTTGYVMFCDASYFSQLVEATVKANDGTVLKAVAVRDPMPLEPRLLNTSNFHYLLSTVVAALSESDTGRDGSYGTKGADIADAFILDEHTRATQGNQGIHLGLDIGSYALTAHGGDIGDFDDPKIMASAFEKAHQLFFTMAVPRFWIPASSQSHTRQGSYVRTLAAFTVDTTFAAVTSGVLFLVAILAVILAVLSNRRTSYLSEDPASITANMRLMSGSFQEYSSLRSKEESRTSKSKSFCIRQNPVTTLPQLEYTAAHERWPVLPSAFPNHDSHPAANPMEFRIPSLSILMAVLSTSIVGICVLKITITRENGLRVPSENTFLSRAVLNYAPTAFATLLESYWVLLTRTSSFLWPFEELRRGSGSRNRTIDAAYTSLPPQLIVFGSMRNKHATLSLLCIVAVLANMLSIAMSGMFQTANTPITHSISLTQGLETAARFNTSTLANNQYDYVYTLQASISGGNTAPSWTDERHVFNPFGWNHTAMNFSQVPITGRTTGVGLNVTCVSITDHFFNDRLDDFVNIIKGYDFNGTRKGIEFVGTTGSSPVFEGDMFQAAWCRTAPRENETVFLVDNSSSEAVTGLAIECRADYRKAEFEVTVDTTGRVSSSKRLTDYDSNLSQINPNASTLGGIAWDNFGLVLGLSSNEDYWHNDTAATDWFNYLLKVLTNSSIIDPELSLPEESVVMSHVEDLFERLFAVYAGLNQEWLFLSTRTPNTTIQGTVLTMEQRVFFSAYMFQIALALLTLNLLVAVLICIRRPKRYLEEMPTTIAAIGSYVAYSNLLAEVKHEAMYGCSESEIADVKIGFGKFIGTDGKPHKGIERHPLVTTL